MSIAQQQCDVCHVLSDVSSMLFIKNTQAEEFSICTNCIKTLHDKVGSIEAGTVEIPEVDAAQLVNKLNISIFGQHGPKEQVSTVISMHYANMKSGNTDNKTTMLFIGPTGSGKTRLIREIADNIKVPMIHIDATTLTEAGYVGHDAQICIEELLRETHGDIAQAEKGIVFIDEVDKIRRKESNGRSKDVNSVGVQQALLKLIEGTIVYVPSPHNPNIRVAVNTKSILFILAGAFEGIFDIIRERIQGTNLSYTQLNSGEGVKHEDYLVMLKQITPQDLEKYGMIREFIGRIPAIIKFSPLSDEDMAAILNQAFKYYQNSLQSNIYFEITDEAKKLLIHKVRLYKTGARAIMSEMWRMIENHIYHIFINKDRKIRLLIEVENGNTVIKEPQIINL